MYLRQSSSRYKYGSKRRLTEGRKNYVVIFKNFLYRVTKAITFIKSKPLDHTTIGYEINGSCYNPSLVVKGKLSGFIVTLMSVLKVRLL